MQPNTLSLSRFGGCLDQTSSGVFISNAVEGHLFIRYVAVETASTQNTFFKPTLVNIHLTLSKMVQLNLSAKPFCCAVPAVVLCLAIPEAAQKLSNASLQNSRPLSVLNLLTFLPVWFSTRVFKPLKFSKVSSLVF